jgi:hypothetical protein
MKTGLEVSADTAFTPKLTLSLGLLTAVNVKLSCNKSLRLRSGMDFRASILTLTFGTTRTAELSALRAGCTLTPRKFLGSHFYYMLSGPQGYWCWQKFRLLQDFKGFHRESNPGPPVLWQRLNRLHHRPSYGGIATFWSWVLKGHKRLSYPLRKWRVVSSGRDDPVSSRTGVDMVTTLTKNEVAPVLLPESSQFLLIAGN